MMNAYRVENQFGRFCFVEASSADNACRIANELNLIPSHHWQDLTATKTQNQNEQTQAQESRK